MLWNTPTERGDRTLWLRRVVLTLGIWICAKGLWAPEENPRAAPKDSGHDASIESRSGAQIISPMTPSSSMQPIVTAAVPPTDPAHFEPERQATPSGTSRSMEHTSQVVRSSATAAAGTTPQPTDPASQPAKALGPIGELAQYDIDWKLPAVSSSGTPEEVRMHPRVNYCRGITAEAAEVAGGVDRHSIPLGCFGDSTDSHRPSGLQLGTTDASLVSACLDGCKAAGQFAFAAVTASRECACSNLLGPRVDYEVPDHDSWANITATEALKRCHATAQSAATVYRLGVWPPAGGLDAAETRIASPENRPVITVFLWANPRLAAIFRTCRLSKMSTAYDYDVFDLRHQVRNPNKVHVAALLKRFPGKKMIVFDGCCVPGWMIMAWPTDTVLVVASDESAQWGFGNKKHYFGPHGPDGLVPSDDERRIILPSGINPWFKQYYSSRHVDFFGGNVRYIPLGSREEFVDAPSAVKPPSMRKFLYSFMGAPTDIGRKKVRDIMAADKVLPKARAFLYMAEHWDADPNSDRNTYIRPERYRSIMLDSVFTLCPKGHSIEQFRLYEAIESGSIPILAKEGYCPGGCPTYANERLPPEYFTSPMIFVQDWDEVVEVMVRLDSNHTALLERQIALRAWYIRYIHAKATEIETAFGESTVKVR